MNKLTEKLLKEIQTRKRKRLQERRLVGKCTAIICHGPGHQNTTYCHNKKKGHKVHETYYGANRQYARWKRQKVFSGFFDEPPQEEL